MTSLVSPGIIGLLASRSSVVLSATAGLTAAVLLVLLLSGKEVVRAWRGNAARMTGFDAAAVPLLVVVLATVVARFVLIAH